MFRILIRASRSLSLRLAHERIECVCVSVDFFINLLTMHISICFRCSVSNKKTKRSALFFFFKSSNSFLFDWLCWTFFREILKITVSLIYASHMKMLIQWRKSKKGEKRHTRKIFGWICVRYKNNFYWCYSVMLFRSLRN